MSSQAEVALSVVEERIAAPKIDRRQSRQVKRKFVDGEDVLSDDREFDEQDQNDEYLDDDLDNHSDPLSEVSDFDEKRLSRGKKKKKVIKKKKTAPVQSRPITNVGADIRQHELEGDVWEYKVERVLAMRIKPIDDLDSSISAEELKRECLIKFKGLSYRSVEWVDEDLLRTDSNGNKVLANFLKSLKKLGVSEVVDEDFTEDQVVNPEWTIVERIVAMKKEQVWQEAEEKDSAGGPSEAVHGATKSDAPANMKLEWASVYLVKWSDLGYTEATWEFVDVVETATEKLDQFTSMQSKVKECLDNPDRQSSITINPFAQVATGQQVAVTKLSDETPAQISLHSMEGALPTIPKPNGSAHDLVIDLSPVRDIAFRDYQSDGVRWIVWQWSQKRSCILADEMGLGKTIQAIGFMEILRVNYRCPGPFMVAVPLSTIRHWQEQFSQHTTANVIIFHGSGEDREMMKQFEFSSGKKGSLVPHFDVMITTNETLLREKSFLRKINWEVLVVDEAHKLKNLKAQTRNSFTEIPSKFRLLLTGTPIQNDTMELFSLLQFMQPARFADEKMFRQQYERVHDAKQVEELQGLLREFMLRREKSDVELSIPDKTEVIIDVELTLNQKQYYKAVLEKNRKFLARGTKKTQQNLLNIEMVLRQVCNHPFLAAGGREAIYLDHEIARRSGGHPFGQGPSRPVVDSSSQSVAESKDNDDDRCQLQESQVKADDSSSILVTTTAAPAAQGSTVLPLTSCEGMSVGHVIVVGSEDLSTAEMGVIVAVDNNVQLAEPLKHDHDVGVKVHVFESTIDAVKCLQSRVIDVKVEKVSEVPVSGDASLDKGLLDPLVYSSGKFVLLHKLLPKLRDSQSKVLIFSQFSKTLNIIEEYLSKYEFEFERIDGSVGRGLREEAIARFNKPESQSMVFLLTTRAGGVGINLQAANTVIIFDGDYNPHGDLQAISRSHRLGQRKNVSVYRFITRHTVEAAMFASANKKLGLTEALLGGLRDMDDDDDEVAEGEEGDKELSVSKGTRIRRAKSKERVIDDLLRRGSYALLTEDEDTAKASYTSFINDSIDRILESHSTLVEVDDKDGYTAPKEKSLFSQVTFVTSQADTGLKMDDEDFWERALPKGTTRIGRLLQNLNSSQREVSDDMLQQILKIAHEIASIRQAGEDTDEKEEILALIDFVISENLFLEWHNELLTCKSTIERPKRHRLNVQMLLGTEEGTGAGVGADGPALINSGGQFSHGGMGLNPLSNKATVKAALSTTAALAMTKKNRAMLASKIFFGYHHVKVVGSAPTAITRKNVGGGGSSSSSGLKGGHEASKAPVDPSHISAVDLFIRMMRPIHFFKYPGTTEDQFIAQCNVKWRDLSDKAKQNLNDMSRSINATMGMIAPHFRTDWLERAVNRVRKLTMQIGNKGDGEHEPSSHALDAAASSSSSSAQSTRDPRAGHSQAPRGSAGASRPTRDLAAGPNSQLPFYPHGRSSGYGGHPGSAGGPGPSGHPPGYPPYSGYLPPPGGYHHGHPYPPPPMFGHMPPEMGGPAGYMNDPNNPGLYPPYPPYPYPPPHGLPPQGMDNPFNQYYPGMGIYPPFGDYPGYHNPHHPPFYPPGYPPYPYPYGPYPPSSSFPPYGGYMHPAGGDPSYPPQYPRHPHEFNPGMPGYPPYPPLGHWPYPPPQYPHDEYNPLLGPPHAQAHMEASAQSQHTQVAQALPGGADETDSGVAMAASEPAEGEAEGDSSSNEESVSAAAPSPSPRLSPNVGDEAAAISQRSIVRSGRKKARNSKAGAAPGAHVKIETATTAATNDTISGPVHNGDQDGDRQEAQMPQIQTSSGEGVETISGKSAVDGVDMGSNERKGKAVSLDEVSEESSATPHQQTGPAQPTRPGTEPPAEARPSAMSHAPPGAPAAPTQRALSKKTKSLFFVAVENEKLFDDPEPFPRVNRKKKETIFVNTFEPDCKASCESISDFFRWSLKICCEKSSQAQNNRSSADDMLANATGVSLLNKAKSSRLPEMDSLVNATLFAILESEFLKMANVGKSDEVYVDSPFKLHGRPLGVTLRKDQHGVLATSNANPHKGLEGVFEGLEKGDYVISFNSVELKAKSLLQVVELIKTFGDDDPCVAIVRRHFKSEGVAMQILEQRIRAIYSIIDRLLQTGQQMDVPDILSSDRISVCVDTALKYRPNPKQGDPGRTGRKRKSGGNGISRGASLGDEGAGVGGGVKKPTKRPKSAASALELQEPEPSALVAEPHSTDANA